MTNAQPTAVFVIHSRPGDRYRAGRTIRALQERGLVSTDLTGLTPACLAEAVFSVAGPVWLLRAGAWPAWKGPVTFPSSSATGRPLVALGLIRSHSRDQSSNGDAREWLAFHAATGGDFSLAASANVSVPSIASAYLEAPAAACLGQRLRGGEELPQALAALLRDDQFRAVHHAPLDVYDDPALRIVQLVTSIQRGGAERITLSLVEQLGRRGVTCRLVTLGRPMRSAFAVPVPVIDLSRRGDRQARAEAVAQVLRNFASDLVHGHLIDGEDAARIAGQGVPLLMTVHNTRPGWPEGLAELRADDAVLLIACGQAVEAGLWEAKVPVRTVWNGIDLEAFERTPTVQAAAEEWRRRLGIGPGDFVLLALANPRPQKRPHLLPGVLAATRAEFAQRGIRRDAHLVFAGEASRGSAIAQRVVDQVHAEIARLDLAAFVHWAGPVEDVAGLLTASDVLVSTSAHEGLSLAQLEAVAAGIPVVATDAGGTSEIAPGSPAVQVVPCDAGPEQFAAILAQLASMAFDPVGPDAAGHFSERRMAERYHWLYPRAIEASRKQRVGQGLWLVSNNFATGGAQSSARRLLLGLASEGIPVRAAVIEEQPEYPTVGRRALTAAGITVIALPPVGTIDPAQAVALLLEKLDADPPAAVLLWNLIAEYKVLLADGLLHIPLYDVSPGEMYFTSFERYFARPRPGLPYRTAADFGRRLAGVIVKYQAEAGQAAAILGAPVHVIPNGVPVVGTPKAPGAAGEQVVIGTLARINPQKKLDELLRALCLIEDRLPPYLLRIAGGVERGCEVHAEELRRLAEGMAVEWVGEIEDTPTFLQGLDLFAMVAEPAGCPNASLEAMAAGLPVVITDVGGAAEQVEDGVTGRIVPRGDCQALAEALRELACDPVRRSHWGAAGRQRVLERFSLARMVADYRRACLVP